MTTRTQTSPGPFARLTLVGRGPQSPNPRVQREPARRGKTKDEDYIPYNGPYEEPPRRRQERNRDSWGDPLYDEDGDAVVQELHQRYAPEQSPWHGEEEERKSRPRARTHSGVSGRTVSSGTVDPHRSSVAVLRKANATRPPVPSYINLGASGGVGESPAQPARVSDEPYVPKRTSLASIFTFGKKLPMSPPTSPSATSPLISTKQPRVFAAPQPRPPSIYSGSADNHKSSASYTSHEDDPFRASHNFTPTADQFGQLMDAQKAASPPHPYAYNFPQRDIPNPPQTAPLVTSPKLKFTARVALPPVRSLKNYASTPNLRNSTHSPSLLRKAPPKGKDRWLSPETWCDAIMFPRPRFKVADAQNLLDGRVVSPPGSPIIGGFTAQPKPDGIASRVLAHSRSMVSLNAEAGPSKPKHLASVVEAVPRAAAPQPPALLSAPAERPPRPKSFALDDLALPSPVPSLARVLEEGQILEHQRKKWQMQAMGSFQNTRSRSLSRARAKSLTHRGVRLGQSNMDFLAARSFLGNQDTIPLVPARTHVRTASQSATNTQITGTTTFNTRSSHSHSNSLVKTMSKSSQGHGRQDSWSRTAIKKAAALCYVEGSFSPAIEQANGLESALREGGTKVIRLVDPALTPVDLAGHLSALSSRNGVSPTPSGTSDAHMGIALSTPPPNDNASERDSIRFPSHPYAQSGLSYAYHNTPASVPVQSADYAGPHATAPVVNPEVQDFATRHRLPPQATFVHHPYAAFSSQRDSGQIVPQPRADSDVPAASKMWAQLSPGPVVREILPSDLLYSPYTSERSGTPEEKEVNALQRNRKSTATILDSFGLGETLAYAVEEENFRDSGLGTSEDHTPNEGQSDVADAHPYRVHRKPVHYDISRPPYAPNKSDETNRTLGSSLLDPSLKTNQRLTPPTPPIPSNSSPSMDSAASSPPRSPPLIASADDLDDYRDLFYRPNLTDEVLHNLSRPTSTRQNSVTWDLASTGRTQRTRTGSGLTSLARQLSQEFEELRAIRQGVHSRSMDTESSISRFSRFPLENDIQFIFTDSDLSRRSQATDRPTLPDEAITAFYPSRHLPEDVESSRASSPIDGPPAGDEDDETYRLGSVGSMATPPATSSAHRTSYMGLMEFGEPSAPAAPNDESRVVSGLQPPPSADPTRSSYMTQSTMSRISQLSDFPVPPPQQMTPAHMSLLNSYFHESVPEASPEDETQSSVTFAPPRVGERF